MFSRLFFVGSAVIIAWISFLDSIVESSVDSCGKYRTSMDDNRYLGHRFTKTFETSTISIPLQCYVKCLNNCLCLSFNVCGGGRNCELNSERKDSDLSQFKENDGCDYYEFDYSQQSSSRGCLDRCCSSSSSQSCLNGGTCQASCMKNGKRYKCACPDGFKGDRCEVLPRSCAAYTPSTNGLRLIYAPDNTTYMAYCHFDEGVGTYTLAMSCTRSQGAANYHSQPLTVDYSVSEDSQNWNNYRLSLARMQGLRDHSTHWVLACSYPTRGLPLADYMRVKISETDLITYKAAALGKCRKVSFISIGGNSCSDCVVGMSQGGVMFHVSRTYDSDCPGAWTGMQTKACSTGVKSRYFGSYACFNPGFSCTAFGAATTQLWALMMH